MPITELDNSDAEILSNVEDADSEVETLSDVDASNAIEEETTEYRAQALHSHIQSSSSGAEHREDRRVVQAAKAIEAAEDLDRATPLSQDLPRQRPSPVLLPAPAEADEDTPLLDAGPFRPPPNYAAATAWRRTIDSQAASIGTAISQETGFSPQLQTNEQPSLPSQPFPIATSAPSTPAELESGHSKEYKRRRSLLHKVCGAINNILYFSLVLFVHAWKLFGVGIMSFVERCTVLSIFMVLGTFIAVLVVLLLKKQGLI